MALVTYVARRSIVVGHVLGVAYEFELPVQETVPGRAHRSAQQESLSGRLESQLYFHKRQYTVMFFPLQTEELDLMLEFVDSVINKETFTFAPYETPVQAFSAILLEPTGYDLQMFMAQMGPDDYLVPPRLVIREL